MKPAYMPAGGGVDARPGDPRGKCGTCKFFIDDDREIEQEIRFLSGSGGVGLVSSERARDAEGAETGEAVARTVTRYRHFGESLAHRMGNVLARAEDLGLCEKGVADITFRSCGTRGETPCPTWQALGKLDLWMGRKNLRPPDWVAKRQALLHVYHGSRPLFSVQGHEPCPVHPGTLFRNCCGRGIL